MQRASEQFSALMRGFLPPQNCTTLTNLTLIQTCYLYNQMKGGKVLDEYSSNNTW